MTKYYFLIKIFNLNYSDCDCTNVYVFAIKVNKKLTEEEGYGTAYSDKEAQFTFFNPYN